METLIFYLPALACGAMMLFICIPTMRNMHKGGEADKTGDREEIAELREEIARLKTERALQQESERVDG